MFVLLSGRVYVYKASAAGGTHLAGSLLPGDVFGGREFFTDADDHVYTAGVESAVFVVTEGTFSDLSWSRPDILFEVFKAAYMPLRKMTASQMSVQTPGAPEPASRTAAAQKATGAKQGKEKKQAETHHKSETAPAPTEGIAINGVGIFPDGHKSFPGITRPEYGSLVFPKEYKCPYCKKSFKDYKVFRSKLYEAAPVRYDLRRSYTDFQTEWYDVITCQVCFFSTFHNYFTEPKPMQIVKFETALDNARASVHLDFTAQRDIDFVFTSHYLALLCTEGYLSLGKQLRAKLWGNLSWLYEDVEDEEMAKFTANKAAEAYEALYAETHLTPVQEQITCLSIAGMQHRAGVDRNLKRFLFTAKTSQQGDKTYAKIAEDFMEELRLDDDEA